jgi:iron complex outermembrane receptor protein
MIMLRSPAFALFLAVMTASTAAGQDPPPVQDLTGLSLGELADLQVSSLVRRTQRVQETPAAVHVVTGDDIRRSGATRLPQAVALAPGTQVARIDANKWAIGIRGFASRLARSTLVLVDGRSVYNPLFAGTYWETQEIFLGDVDRIEVVRGPGGAIWGANAVNGVVNILTLPATQTAGGIASLRWGSEMRSLAGRLGKVSGDTGFRVHLKLIDEEGGHNDARPGFDEWWMGRVGFRVDHGTASRRELTVTGDVYDGELGQMVRIAAYDPPTSSLVEDRADMRGGHLLARLRQGLGEESQLEVQASYDRSERDEAHFDEQRDTLDLQAVHRLRGRTSGELVWGAGVRQSSGRSQGVETVFFDPPDRTDHILSLFAQYERPLGSRLVLSGGAKLERNDYSGFEVQPNLRALGRLDSRNVVWASVSQAVRTPSRTERDLSLTFLADPGVPAFVRILGDDRFGSEMVTAVEAGWRSELAGRRLRLDLAAFRNRYRHLLSLEPGAPYQEAGRRIPPLLISNLVDGTTQGLEATATGRLGRLGVQGSWSWLHLDLTPREESLDTGQEAAEDMSPAHQVKLHAFLELAHGIELSGGLRHVSELPGRTPSYTELDTRVAWTRGRARLALVGENLLHARHLEWPGGDAGDTSIERAFYAQAALLW